MYTVAVDDGDDTSGGDEGTVAVTVKMPTVGVADPSAAAARDPCWCGARMYLAHLRLIVFNISSLMRLLCYPSCRYHYCSEECIRIYIPSDSGACKPCDSFMPAHMYVEKANEVQCHTYSWCRPCLEYYSWQSHAHPASCGFSQDDDDCDTRWQQEHLRQ